MYIFIDDSKHCELDFMLLGYVICHNNPQQKLSELIHEFKVDEYHSSEVMNGNTRMQQLRARIRSYINSNCRWGVFVLPRFGAFIAEEEMSDFIYTLIRNIGGGRAITVYFDEGIINKRVAERLCRDVSSLDINVCKSHDVIGIQLADLISALCGVRLREEISQSPKILTFGTESGFDPPIQAELGYELWASLRYSMCRKNQPLGEDMPEMAEFETSGFGFFVSPKCLPHVKESAKKLFGKIYLGCIH